ncbi:MAG: NfeD family protein [Nevskia sp.]|nr:NfeD family protein [Nevskia sp.]
MTLSSAHHWLWWVAGLALMALEAFFPGAFFLWIGIAALLVGGVSWLLPGLGGLTQMALFAVVAIGSILAWRRWRGGRQVVDSGLNDRARHYLGRTFTLDAPIVNGVGQMRVDDGQWRISGADLPVASRVRVVAVEGTVLKVEKAD